MMMRVVAVSILVGVATWGCPSRPPVKRPCSRKGKVHAAVPFQRGTRHGCSLATMPIWPLQRSCCQMPRAESSSLISCSLRSDSRRYYRDIFGGGEIDCVIGCRGRFNAISTNRKARDIKGQQALNTTHPTADGSAFLHL